jgi:hypothetical protein
MGWCDSNKFIQTQHINTRELQQRETIYGAKNAANQHRLCCWTLNRCSCVCCTQTISSISPMASIASYFKNNLNSRGVGWSLFVQLVICWGVVCGVPFRTFLPPPWFGCMLLVELNALTLCGFVSSKYMLSVSMVL